MRLTICRDNSIGEMEPYSNYLSIALVRWRVTICPLVNGEMESNYLPIGEMESNYL